MRIFKLPGFSVNIFGLMMDKAHAQMDSSEADHSSHAITILTEDYAFQAPDQVPSGWTRIEYINEGEEPHFLILARLPEGKTGYFTPDLEPGRYLFINEGTVPLGVMQEVVVE